MYVDQRQRVAGAINRQPQRLQHSMHLVALSRLVPGRYDVCPGAKQVAAAEMALRSVCAGAGRDRGSVLRPVRCCHVG